MPADVDQIQCPALLIAGDEDQSAPLQQSRFLAKAIPRSRFILLSRVAHMTALERPREVIQAVLNFHHDNLGGPRAIPCGVNRTMQKIYIRRNLLSPNARRSCKCD